ncbi:MAG TPA: class I SAM-dependent methyltransferase [Bauldia sp.]|nr:class I SAM-dependent methyltransferase [Bauldia sp.]
MYLDVVDLRAFYAERIGVIVARLIGVKLRRRWPSVEGQRLVGIGYATPYLRQFGGAAESAIAFMPAVQGVVNWPPEGPNATALIEDDELPLRDASVDRVLVVHALEMAADARNVLKEIWRVLAPGGRVILVVPNRRGLWTRGEATPFGYGRPFSRGQLTALLRESLFSPLGWSEALCMPPIRRRIFVKNGAAWERLGLYLWPAFAGVYIVEATKQLYAGIPARGGGRVRAVLRPALVPPGA